MPDADRLRLAGRVPSDYEGYGYAPLLANDLAAVAAVAGDVAASALAAEDSAAAADASAAVAAAGAVAAVNTTLNGLVTTATTQATSASNSATTAATQAGIATTQATAAATSRAQAENAVAAVTVGSTNSLAYPEQIRSLVTAADVVDVMIYDTRLDSDGGAWTERCAGTSTALEPLNTATRGAKRLPPKVMLLVLRAGTTNTLSVYDALELDPATDTPRLWRIWPASPGGILDGTQRAVTGAQGRILIGSTLGLYTLDLAADRALRRDNAGLRVWSGPLTAAGEYGAAQASGAIGAASVLALDARVLPGAPLDALTGLAVPTIVAATANDLSVVHPDQRVSTVTIGGGYGRARFTTDNRIIARRSGDPSVGDVGPIPYAATTVFTAWRSFTFGNPSIGATGIPLPAVNGLRTLEDTAQGTIAQARQVLSLAETPGNHADAMVAATGDVFATGWMPSTAIHLAAMCDGTTGSVTQSGELITNGSFDANMAGWSSTVATLAAVAGVAEVTAVGGGTPVLWQNVNLVAGQTYVATARAERISGRPQVVMQIAGAVISPARTAEQLNVGWGPLRITFVANTTGTAAISIYEATGAASAGLAFRADDVSVRAASADRSYRENGLEIVGTLNRAAVATGADLAAWSGFTASNYLEQPYNSGLDFGTGDFCVALWMQTSGVVNALLTRRAPGNTGPQFAISNGGGSPQLPRFVIGDGTNTAFVTATTPPAGAGWTQIVAVRRGTTIEIWLNGVLEGTASAASVGSLNSPTAVLRVGGDFVGTGTPASLALVRIAGYAPTPEQIERMFRDERVLFRPGARAFLGGGTTATVRRISRSRFSNRLAVAMSDGLAVMDGLQRVERHTTATLSPAMASDSVTPVSMESGLMLIGTASNAGVRRDAVIGMDRLPATQPTPGSPRVFRASGVTVDATPLTIAPRIPVGERETVVVSAIIVARVYGASDTQRLTYERRATYFRDAGGNVTLAGSVQVIGTDVEVTGTADATLAIDTTAQTIAAQVTGIAATRLVWTVRYRIERATHDTTYEEVV